MHLALAATTDPGDTVLLLDPTYSVYWDLATFLGLKVRSCPQTIERGFQPDPECLEKVVDRDVKVVVLVSPDNPTSRVISEDVAKLVVNLASEYDAWILYDEAYKHVVYEGQHVWLHRYSGALERLIGVNSFSKDIAIPGFRLGYLYAPKEVVDEVVKLKGILSIVSPVPAQWFAYYALTSDIKERYLRRVIPIYRSRRDEAYKAFRKYLPEAITELMVGLSICGYP
jgi:aspartate aminotransferase